jgi:hypothetical protein
MKMKAGPWTSRAIRRLRETWAEMDYLQRRLIELQMDAAVASGPAGAFRERIPRSNLRVAGARA